MKFDYNKIQNMTEFELTELYMSIHKHRLQTPVTYIKWETARHHFNPKSMGGNDSKENYIRITNEEHFICHYILHKIHGGKMTSAFAFLAHGFFTTESIIDDCLHNISLLFQAEDKAIRKNASERVSGKNNNSYGKFGKDHPTSSFDKSGVNNPNYGKIASKLCKKRTSETNSNHVIVKNILTNEIYKVDTDTFNSDINLVGATHGTKVPQIKNTVSCLDLDTGLSTRVDSNIFYDSPNLVAHCSKLAKQYKKAQNEI